VEQQAWLVLLKEKIQVVVTEELKLKEIAAEHKLVLADPAVTVHVDALADSSVNLFCRPWVKTGDYWTVHCDLTRQVKERFDAEGISIPFPQRDVHMQPESAEV